MSVDHPKFTVVGDGATGKTCILVSFAKNEFPEDYVPTVFDNYSTEMQVDGNVHTVMLWDTAGQEDYASVRPLSYDGTKVFIVVFSVDNRTSYENIPQWKKELDEHASGVPIVLVGNKIDLRGEGKTDENGDPMITEAEGKEAAKKIGAVAYIECSAKTQTGLQDIFITCVRVTVGTHKKEGGSSSKKDDENGGGCCILM